MIKHPTPRTDRNIATIKELTNIICTPIVRADFARELECEVIELKNDIELAAGELNDIKKQIAVLKKQREFLKENLIYEREHNQNVLDDMIKIVKEPDTSKRGVMFTALKQRINYWHSNSSTAKEFHTEYTKKLNERAELLATVYEVSKVFDYGANDEDWVPGTTLPEAVTKVMNERNTVRDAIKAKNL